MFCLSNCNEPILKKVEGLKNQPKMRIFPLFSWKHGFLLGSCHFSPLKDRKERKSPWPHTHVKCVQRFVGLSEYNYIRKMLNKNHFGKVPSKAAER